MKKVIVYSGGMDSTVLLYELVNNFGKENVLALNVNYGSKHNFEEYKRARANCDLLGVKIKRVVLPLDNLFKSNLLQGGEEIPEGHYAESNMKKTVVPFRNAIMLSIATGYAESEGPDSVFIANHAGDHAVYPDCRATFIDSFREAMAYGTYNNVKLYSPFVGRTKAEIAAYGEVLGVDFSLTYSCYKGGTNQCGRCSTCFERREALVEAGVEDSTYYLDQTPFDKLKKQYDRRLASERS